MSRLLDAMAIADYVAIGALIAVLLLGWGFGFAYTKNSGKRYGKNQP